MQQPRQRHAKVSISNLSMEPELSKHSSTKSLPSKGKESLHVIPTYIAFGIVVLLCLLYGGVYLIYKTVPSGYKISDEENFPNAFIAERAQKILKELTDIGPRVVGSAENEVQAIQYLGRVIDDIIQEAHASFTITKDIQITSGAYYLEFANEYINSYAKVQNIIVMIEGRNTKESILINAHFDSVPTSPGASDDGIMVSVMLEALRKLTQRKNEYERNIIFLLNGAEETGLQAAHGFITQHKWSKTCKTIINLEACGHGGRAILFQSGPKHSSALMSHYSFVPYPYGQAAGEEIFQSGILPSDTDFRVFRDFGNLSGFDFAFSQNGYRYHTKNDNFEDIPLGSYQHAGSNLLALVRRLAQESSSFEEDDDKVVYFDIFNWFLISYSVMAAYIINIIVVIFSFVAAILSARRLNLGFNKLSGLYLLYATGTTLGSWVVATGIALLIAVIIDATNNTMTWYGHSFIIFGLYVAPIFGSFCSIMWIFNYFGPHVRIQSQIQMHTTRLIWSLALLVGALLKIRSVYFIMVLILFNTLASLVISLLKWENSVRKWQLCYIIFSLIPIIFMMYMSVEIFSLLIPIMGRFTSKTNPEFLIGLLTVLISILIATQYMSFTVQVRRQYLLPLFFFAVFLVTFFVVVAHGAFPYSGNSKSLTPQRFYAFHTNRIFYDAEGRITENSGIYIPNNDRNSPNSVMEDIGLKPYDLSEDCEKYPACGMPLANTRSIPSAHLSSWKLFPKAVIKETTSMTYTSKTLSSNVVQYQFIVEGPDHLTVLIKPVNGSKILQTNLAPIKTDQILFISHTYGKEKTNLEFTLDMEAENLNIPLLHLVASGKYYNFNEKERKIKEFDDFLAKFPSWTDVAPGLATYQSYII